jgi:tetratricopeptide (TPR) repeat protein
LRFVLIAFAVLRPLLAGQACASCHPKEVVGFSQSAMGRSLSSTYIPPDGAFEHEASHTQFAIKSDKTGTWQSLTRGEELQKERVAYQIGSGSHAMGFLIDIEDHLFQSPLSYYTKRRTWDMAPGYEGAQTPDFSRPVTVECLTCHADRPRPVADTLNEYENPAFAQLEIGCDRCHGPAEAHLKNPTPGSIINPIKLSEAARDSICEQCHLAGEIRIPNPGKAITDFAPGQRIEDVYTVYVAAHAIENEIKVISQSEELAQSLCARNSGGKLWCGTCHDPHNVPARPVEYYRDRCLSCHAGSMPSTHTAANQNCIGCHMPKRRTKDGGHTAFTDHRITRRVEPEGKPAVEADLAAWREPLPELRDRNLALALVTEGLQDGVPDRVIRGYKMLNRLESRFPRDLLLLTELGTVLLTAKQPTEAERRFALALQLRPNYAPYEVNLGDALLEGGNLSGGLEHLERAAKLDPLLPQAIHLLERAYRMQGEISKAEQLSARYRAAMGITIATRLRDVQ